MAQDDAYAATVLSSKAPNVAREIVLDLNLPSHVTGVTCSRACLSGAQAVLQAVDMIETGKAHCIVAGGGDSMSHGALSHFVLGVVVEKHLSADLHHKKSCQHPLHFLLCHYLPTTSSPTSTSTSSTAASATKSAFSFVVFRPQSSSCMDDSAAELTAPRPLARALALLSQSKKKDFKTFLKFFQSAGSPLSWFPERPSISERSTGRTMVCVFRWGVSAQRICVVGRILIARNLAPGFPAGVPRRSHG